MIHFNQTRADTQTIFGAVLKSRELLGGSVGYYCSIADSIAYEKTFLKK